MYRSATAALGAAALASVALSACGGSSAAPQGSHAKSSRGSAAAGTSAYSYGNTSTAVATSSRSARATVSSAATTIVTKKQGKLGTILAAGKQQTLYMFAADKDGKSMCNGACPETWPPLTTSGKPQASGGASASALGTITRSNGQKQVTYDGHPLYFYAPDVSPSDAFGEGVDSFGARWYVLSPSGKSITKG